MLWGVEGRKELGVWEGACGGAEGWRRWAAGDTNTLIPLESPPVLAYRLSVTLALPYS